MNRFFRILWRINALIIFLAGLGALVALGFVLVMTMVSRWPSSPAKMADSSSDLNKLEWSISGTRQLDGTDLFRSALTTSREYFGSGGSSYQIRNFRYYDALTGEMWWLLPTTQTSLITESEDYCLPKQPSEHRTILWSSYCIAEQDTPNDKKVSFAVSQANGKNLTVLLPGIDHVLESSLLGPTDLVVFYKKDDKYLVSRIDLTKGEVLSTKELFGNSK
jgi:hypothetical protein